VSKGSLALYMKRAGAISGPLLSPTRHSDMGTTKTWLIGQTVSFGYKSHNNFGSATHLRFLLRKRGKFKLTKDEEKKIEGMMKELDAHPVVRKLMSLCPTREKRRKKIRLNGVLVNLTPDANGLTIIIDLKTTACDSFDKFLASCIKYGYFRQGKTYSIALRATGLSIKEYWIIGIEKNLPHKVFLVHINEYKEWMTYVERELEFLLYFYNGYGKPNYRRKNIA